MPSLPTAQLLARNARFYRVTLVSITSAMTDASMRTIMCLWADELHARDQHLARLAATALAFEACRVLRVDDQGRVLVDRRVARLYGSHSADVVATAVATVRKAAQDNDWAEAVRALTYPVAYAPPAASTLLLAAWAFATAASEAHMHQRVAAQCANPAEDHGRRMRVWDGLVQAALRRLDGLERS